MIAERDETPSLLDERRRADVVRMEGRPRPGELRCGRLLGVGRELLVAIDEAADVVLELRQLGEDAIHLLEIGDDLALGGLALGPGRRAIDLARNGVVFLPESGNR